MGTSTPQAHPTYYIPYHSNTMSEQQQKNQEVIFASRPKDKPTPDNFKLQDCAYPQLSADGEFLVKILYLSVDPYMRPKMTVEGSYTETYEVGKPMYGDAVARCSSPATAT